MSAACRQQTPLVCLEDTVKRIRAKLTKRLIDSLDPPIDDDSYIVTDTEDDGLRLRVFASGRKRFALEYRIRGRVRWFGFGWFGDMTVEQARNEASKLRTRIMGGFDPVEAKALERIEPTFSEYADRWMTRAKLRKKPSSQRNDTMLLRLYLLPTFGRRKIRSVTRSDMSRLRDSLAAKRTTANRVLALASTIFNAAEADDERDANSNPCRHVQHFKERRVERPLTDEEIGNLWSVLNTADEAPAAVAAIRFLLLTGLRCGEALALRWTDVDLEGARLRLRDSKTGPRKVLLSQPAAEFLDALPRSNEFVFPGKPTPGPEPEERPLADLTHPWQRIRAIAGLADVRLHDLRHTFATKAIAANITLEHLGPLMGHRNIATTQRYAHLLEATERRATDTVGAALFGAISTPVAKLRKSRRERPLLRLVK
jgi:integrase